MPIQIPATWPARRWHEDTPLGHLETIAADAPSGTVPDRWEVESWSTVREISSSALPGQVRHKTGLSVGTAKARIKRASGDYPWKRAALYNLTGKLAQIKLAPEGRAEIPTGQFRVAPIEGDLTTLGVDVDLDERTIAGSEKTANALGEQFVSNSQITDAIFDPAWWVAELAQQMGYGVTAKPGAEGYSPMLDVPLQGSLAPAYPVGIDYRIQTTGGPTWGELDGVIALTNADGQFVRYAMQQSMSTLMMVTFDAYDRVEMQWIRSDQTTNGRMRLTVQNRTLADPNQFTVTMSSVGLNGTANADTSVTYSFPVPADRPSGIQVQVEMTGSTSGNNWNSARFRARRGRGSAWGAWSAVHTFTNALSPVDTDYSFWMRPNKLPGTTTAYLSRVTMVDQIGSSPNKWTEDQLWDAHALNQQHRIWLEPLLGTNTSPWLPPDLSVWGALQEIVNAWQGALITDVYGDLHLLNRLSLVGVGNGSEGVIDVGTSFEDLPWVMDYNDQADRLVVKYRPATIRRYEVGDPSIPVVWELQDVVPVYPGSKDIFFTLNYVYPVDLKLLPFVRKDNDDGFRHVWDAYRYNNGTGNHILPGDEIQLRIDRVTSSTWKVFVRNLTTSPFHLVDNTGTPWLKIRSSFWYDQTTEATVERGAAATDARNALEVDLSNYVQNETDAAAIADFLWQRVNRRTWRAETVNAVPDYSIELGDVRQIVHERTGVRTNVLIAKVDLSGQAGQVVQKLDLILIPPSWDDFDEAWGPEYPTSPPGSWTEFDALWAPYTWNDFDLTPTATTTAQIKEGME